MTDQNTARAIPIDKLTNESVENITLIASGKGGVGKTWFSITLAYVLASLNKKVLLFDGDFGLANIDIQLALNPQHDLGDVIEGNIDFKNAITNYKEGKFDILAGRSGSGKLADLSPERVIVMREDLGFSANDYDSVLIDLGAGVGGIVKNLTPIAGKCLLIINDEPTSITDAYAFLKVTKHNHPNLSFQIIVNQAENERQGKSTYDGFANVCHKFLNYTPKLAGIIHKDSLIKDSIRHQTSIFKRHPNSIALKDVCQIAKDMF